MKGTITQYVALGVMLLLMVLIVSMYPERNGSVVTGKNETPTSVSKLTINSHSKLPVRAD